MLFNVSVVSVMFVSFKWTADFTSASISALYRQLSPCRSGAFNEQAKAWGHPKVKIFFEIFQKGMAT